MNYNQYVEYVKDNKIIYNIYDFELNCGQISIVGVVR